ncbi:nucleotidyltransferase family protein [Psychroserpens sp. XS_ASV72]|uniref:nucleotidyltransferase family protein n=1 Tax=Psychroserpens sp. XS_ASV72 TaxID=3241293 RepID=UPI003512C0B4
MALQSATYKKTHHLIADILSFENPIEDLKTTLKSDAIDWDQFVIVASDYLVLTTCYCRLKQKELLQYLPEDLKEYLENITDINRNRNHSLTREITAISKLLNQNNINYIFLKGSAILVRNYLEDLGERMIGDIDILVQEDQVEKAYDLLIDFGYKGTPAGISSTYFDYKHLPRLQSENHLAAVEVHKKLTQKSFDDILDPNGLLSRQEQINGVNVVSDEDLILHMVLNFQANDSGYAFSRISFKSIYDILILKRIIDYDFKNVKDLPYFKHYFSIAKLFFSDFKNFDSHKAINSLFLLKLKNSFANKSINFIIRRFIFLKAILTTRIGMFLRNKAYRKAVIKDYKRIIGIRQLNKA